MALSVARGVALVWFPRHSVKTPYKADLLYVLCVCVCVCVHGSVHGADSDCRKIQPPLVKNSERGTSRVVGVVQLRRCRSLTVPATVTRSDGRLPCLFTYSLRRFLRKPEQLGELSSCPTPDTHMLALASASSRPQLQGHFVRHNSASLALSRRRADSSKRLSLQLQGRRASLHVVLSRILRVEHVPCLVQMHSPLTSLWMQAATDADHRMERNTSRASKSAPELSLARHVWRRVPIGACARMVRAAPRLHTKTSAMASQPSGYRAQSSAAF